MNYLQMVQRMALKAQLDDIPQTMVAASGIDFDMGNHVNDVYIETVQDDHFWNQKLWGVRLLGVLSRTGSNTGTAFSISVPGLDGDGVADTNIRQDYTHAKVVWDGETEVYEIATVDGVSTATFIVAKADHTTVACEIFQDTVFAPPDLEALEVAWLWEPSGTYREVEVMGLDKLLRMRSLRGTTWPTDQMPVRCSMWARTDVTYDSQGKWPRRVIVVDPPPSADSSLIIGGRARTKRLSLDADTFEAPRSAQPVIQWGALGKVLRDQKDQSQGVYWRERFKQGRQALKSRTTRTTSRARITATIVETPATGNEEVI
jgi:hypothetical protein